ncbi:unnamed protein product [Macrosiphum euphorbiae]|uniref:Uncharacterized protein n=1 Tax=Macrosiphum euphorbiae TaxID=13131 RepID=A0AAV0XHL4_9HEMI|nr:unnamed protein product [Macrosiphum euphorbiae]
MCYYNRLFGKVRFRRDLLIKSVSLKLQGRNTPVTPCRGRALKPSYSNSRCSSENRSFGNLQTLWSRETRGEFIQNIFVKFRLVSVIRRTFKYGLRKPGRKCGNNDSWWFRGTRCRCNRHWRSFRI